MHEPMAVAPLPSEAEPREGTAGSWAMVGDLGAVRVQGRGAGAVGVPVSPSGSMGVSWPELSQVGTLWDAGPSHPHVPGCWAAESFPMQRLISHSSSDLFPFSHFNKDESIRKRGCTCQRARSDIIKKWLQSGCFPNGLSYQPARPCTPCAPNPLRHHLHFLITPH